MSNEIKGSYLNIEEINKSSGEVLTLVSTAESSIQVVPLMRLGLFVPTLKSTSKAVANKGEHVNASSDLRHLEIAKSEGFQQITISGVRLDMDTDFKVWMGIIATLTDDNYTVDSKGRISIPLRDFATKCGYPKTRTKTEIRDRINKSIQKIMSTVVSFSKDLNTDKSVTRHVHLIGESTVDLKNDIVTITPNESLKDLYASEYKVLLKRKVLNMLSKKESAQALYLFLEALPQNPFPISMDRLKQRLNLTSHSGAQAMTIRKALKQLSDIGYLEYQELKDGHAVSFRIISRNSSC